jgi:hypothetical protein
LRELERSAAADGFLSACVGWSWRQRVDDEHKRDKQTSARTPVSLGSTGREGLPKPTRRAFFSWARAVALAQGLVGNQARREGPNHTADHVPLRSASVSRYYEGWNLQLSSCHSPWATAAPRPFPTGQVSPGSLEQQHAEDDGS